MSDRSPSDEARRRFLMLVGGGAIGLPLAGLSACGSKESAPAPTAPEPANETPTAQPPPTPATSPAAPTQGGTSTPADLPRVSEAEPLAVALGYRHDATQIDRAKYPRFEVGQVCRNCIQWKGGDADEWGPCGIFPGKLVNANGWCSTYARKG